jgi:hypothetical protein
MSQLVKTKRQANFRDFKRFGAFKGIVEQKNIIFNSFVCKLGLFWHGYGACVWCGAVGSNAIQAQILYREQFPDKVVPN